jgi:hypothetical protein
LPASGTLIYGAGFRRRTIRIENHVARTLQNIDAIETAWREQKPPALVLNRHCAICDFQLRCRGIAAERDDLSLLAAMTAKERAKCAAKGIFTITQLSYGYRPRRRKRNRPDAERSRKSASGATPPAKNDHKLKALAIKKHQIHVVGAPQMQLEGVPPSLTLKGCRTRTSTTS